MPTKEELIEKHTHPRLETGPRVFHTIDTYGGEPARRSLTKAFAWLVAKLEADGTLKRVEIDEMLLHAVL